MHKRYWTLILLLWSLFTLAACQLPGELPDDGPPIAVSEEAAASLEQKAIEVAGTSGPSTITVTQEELTSYLALRIDPLAAENGVENPWRNPQVYFKGDGSIILRGDIEFEGQSQPIRVVAKPTATDGTLNVDIVEGRIGPVPVPTGILDQVEDQLAQAILAGQNYARVDSVVVEEGTLTVTGERTQ